MVNTKRLNDKTKWNYDSEILFTFLHCLIKIFNWFFSLFFKLTHRIEEDEFVENQTQRSLPVIDAAADKNCVIQWNVLLLACWIDWILVEKVYIQKFLHLVKVVSRFVTYTWAVLIQNHKQKTFTKEFNHTPYYNNNSYSNFSS